MDGLQSKISEARKAGYGDDEIVQFLAQMPTVGAQVNEALKNQYQPNEILKFLAEQSHQHTRLAQSCLSHNVHWSAQCKAQPLALWMSWLELCLHQLAQ